MKKILFFAAATAVALSSCSKNEVEGNFTNPANAIGFSNYVGTSTKGSVVNGASINKSGSEMGVFAEYVASGAATTGESNFMKNTKVTRGASDWSYSPLKYWPTAGTINFCAYYPYDGTAGHATAGTSSTYPSVYFEQKLALTEMVDFVYATADDQTKSSIDNGTTDTDGKVNFAFKHALSRIAFSARPAEGLATADAANSTFITVTGLKVTPVANKVVKNGTLTFDKTASPYAAMVAESTTPEYHAASDWSLAMSSPVVLCKDGETPSATLAQEASTVSYPLTNANSTTDDYIFLVPQDFTSATDDYMEVEVEYTITTYDSNFTSGKIEFTGNTKTVAMPKMEFEQGKAYNFPLVISLDAIVFGDVTVDAWSESNVDVE